MHILNGDLIAMVLQNNGFIHFHLQWLALTRQFHLDESHTPDYETTLVFSTLTPFLSMSLCLIFTQTIQMALSLLWSMHLS
jgi:hypothetical protein